MNLKKYVVREEAEGKLLACRMDQLPIAIISAYGVKGDTKQTCRTDDDYVNVQNEVYRLAALKQVKDIQVTITVQYNVIVTGHRTPEPEIVQEANDFLPPPAPSSNRDRSESRPAAPINSQSRPTSAPAPTPGKISGDIFTTVKTPGAPTKN